MANKDKYLKDYTMIHNIIIRTEKLDVYQKSCINNILSNEDNFKMSLNALAKRIPSSRDKCIKVINTLKELKIVSVNKVKTPNGDWDSNVYKVNLDELFKYLEVVFNKDNVVFNKDYLVFDKDNGSISEIPQVVVENDTKNTNKNTNIENKKENGTSIDKIINSYTQNEGLRNTLKEFLKMRKSIKKPMTDRAMTLLINKLDKLGANDNEKIEILNQSIFNSWQGVFELKNKEISKGKTIDISAYITK
ncbi:hypothetical protein NE398_14095 [Clostridium tertium]|uniref:Uncharacterized protein n=1 Tax=Clostridium tertium TaxID=1559 RepID=A0A9X3XKG0_9CLOT|nr:hypothetical protein [Clostridium tertium]MDC4241285.1 hypothetical protein [Clostridium tertium]